MHATYREHSTLRVLPKSYKLGGVSSTPIFDHLGAASWHRGDAGAIKAIGVAAEWVLVPWKIIVIAVSGVGLTVWVCRRRNRRKERSRKEDVELFDVEREELLAAEGRGESGDGERERRELVTRLWRDSVSSPDRSISPSSCVSSSESTLRAGDDDMDEPKDRKVF